MQDLSQITGKVIVKIAGAEVMLEGFCFEDIGTVQGEFLKQKRKEIYQSALDMRGVAPPDVCDREWDKAVAEARKFVITKEEFEAWSTTNEGISTLFWVLAERQYPSRFTRSQILQSFLTGGISEAQSLELMQSLEAIQQRGKS